MPGNIKTLSPAPHLLTLIDENCQENCFCRAFFLQMPHFRGLPKSGLDRQKLQTTAALLSPSDELVSSYIRLLEAHCAKRDEDAVT
jgi:hypothetical protein